MDCGKSIQRRLDGVEITELQRSNIFMDGDDDGLSSRTAWAGVGDGVLFVDVDGDNEISAAREYVFTHWAPDAASDLEALRRRFDSNGDGKLTASDADFADFKVMVTKADGTLEAKTLVQLGLTQLNLKGNAHTQQFADRLTSPFHVAGYIIERAKDVPGGLMARCHSSVSTIKV